jgi:hypothetical protein
MTTLGVTINLLRVFPSFSLDRFNETLSIAKWNAELFEIAFRQIPQHVAADRVLAENRLISVEAKASQPTPEIHDGPQVTPDT